MKEHWVFICLTLLFSHAKSITVNSFAHMHLPNSHIPELLLPVHCWLKLQNPPTGTVSEMIKMTNKNTKSKKKNWAKNVKDTVKHNKEKLMFRTKYLDSLLKTNVSIVLIQYVCQQCIFRIHG